METETIIYKSESYEIQGAIYEVYREIGYGFLEAIYQGCLEKEFKERKIPYSAQQEFDLSYKGIPLNLRYKPDFVCYDRIIVELKAVKEIKNEHKAQLLNYLKVTGMKLGFLVNFGSYPKASILRFVQ